VTVSRSLLKTLLVPAVTMGMLASTSAAFASTAGHSAPSAASHHANRLIKEGLYVVGFNAAIAKAHGYKIITYKNGDQQSVPINPRSHLPKSPIVHPGATPSGAGYSTPGHDTPGSIKPNYDNTDYNEYMANCGTAWIFIEQTGENRVELNSGFFLSTSFDPAVDYSWNVSLNDANGSSNQTAGGWLDFDYSWTGTWTNLYQYKYTYDYIASGQADLSDGEVCFAGAPDVAISGLN
jgi:hypothetical protein